MKPVCTLEVRRVSKVFRDDDGSAFHALRDVSLCLDAGECVGIVGQSGSGKSTLARLVSKRIEPTEGEIVLDGISRGKMSHKEMNAYFREVQMVFQSPYDTFSPRMTIEHYLMEPFLNYKICSKRVAREKARDLLEMVGLNARDAHKRPDEFSGGQLQRVVIARAVALDPKLIIFDEATSALDVTIQKQIIELIMRLKKENGFACMFITHDLALTEIICDRVFVMHEGALIEEVSMKKGLLRAEHPHTRKLMHIAQRLCLKEECKRA